MGSFNDNSGAFRLVSTFDGRIVVYTDESKFTGITDLAGFTASTIKSISLFVVQVDDNKRYNRAGV
jgi:hypothetical protein